MLSVSSAGDCGGETDSKKVKEPGLRLPKFVIPASLSLRCVIDSHWIIWIRRIRRLFLFAKIPGDKEFRQRETKARKFKSKKTKS